MPYILDKERYHDMDKERTFGLVKAFNMEIPISRCDYDYFIRDRQLRQIIIEFEKSLTSIYEESKLKTKLINNLHMCLIPDYVNDCFYLGYSPKYIIKTIYDLLGIKSSVRLDNTNEIQFKADVTRIKKELKDYIDLAKKEVDKANNSLKDCFNSKEFEMLDSRREYYNNRYKFALATYNNLDNIVKLYEDRTISKYSVNKTIVNRKTGVKEEKDIHIAWRNLAYLISINSLHLYRISKNEKYLVYPYNFYLKCTKKDFNGKQMMFADQYYSEYAKYDSKFINFNNECENIFSNSTLKLDLLLNYKDNNRIMVNEQFKPKKLSFSETELKDYVKNKVGKSRGNADSYDIVKANEQLESKLATYSHDSDFGKHVVARTLISDKKNNGYIGFILDNDNIVLDRFYKEYKDGKSIPVYDEAVYALPLDLYESFGHNMSTIKQNMKHPLVLHKYHTKNNSYKDALLELTKKESISILKVENFAKMYGIKVDKTKKLTSNKKD